MTGPYEVNGIEAITSFTLFSLHLEIVLRKSCIYSTDTAYYESHQYIAYADDIVLLAKSEQELARVIKSLVA